MALPNKVSVEFDIFGTKMANLNNFWPYSRDKSTFCPKLRFLLLLSAVDGNIGIFGQGVLLKQN